MSRSRRSDGIAALIIFCVSIALAVVLVRAMLPHTTGWSDEPAVESVAPPTPPAPAPTASDGDAWCVQSDGDDCVSRLCESSARTVVVFHADWCGWCHELQERTLSDPRVTAYLRQYSRVLVDFDANPDLAERYGINGLPTIVVLQRGCDEIGRIARYIEPEELIETLDGFRSRP